MMQYGLKKKKKKNRKKCKLKDCNEKNYKNENKN
jgi:hypothetical protein